MIITRRMNLQKDTSEKKKNAYNVKKMQSKSSKSRKENWNCNTNTNQVARMKRQDWQK